jgi:hypothetical protein
LPLAVIGAEEPNRRLTALHGADGRLDAVTATWQLLQCRLDDLDIDVHHSARLYQTLTAVDAEPPTAAAGTARLVNVKPAARLQDRK